MADDQPASRQPEDVRPPARRDSDRGRPLQVRRHAPARGSESGRPADAQGPDGRTGTRAGHSRRLSGGSGPLEPAGAASSSESRSRRTGPGWVVWPSGGPVRPSGGPVDGRFRRLGRLGALAASRAGLRPGRGRPPWGLVLLHLRRPAAPGTFVGRHGAAIPNAARAPAGGGGSWRGATASTWAAGRRASRSGPGLGVTSGGKKRRRTRRRSCASAQATGLWTRTSWRCAGTSPRAWAGAAPSESTSRFL